MDAKTKEVVMPRFLESDVKNLLIHGVSHAALSGKYFLTRSPTTGEVLAQVAEAGVEDVNLAVASSRRAFEGPWSKFTPFERQAVLLKLADLVELHYSELAMLDTLDMGAPISSTLARRQRCVGLIRFYAGLATSTHGLTIPNSSPGNMFSYTLKEAVGVVAAINPWNAPLSLAIWKVAPALAAGCTVIVKPAEQAPLSPLRFGELCLEAGIPPGVVNVITGYGAVGAALVNHPDVNKVAFTGSTEVGQAIVRASAGNLKRLSLELGGKSPNIVFSDANLDAAVPGAAMAVFANSGQVCSAGTRLFVHRPIYDEFVQRVADYAKTLRVGNPTDPKTELGPLVSEAQLDRVVGYLAAGKREGAKAIAGGERATHSGMDAGYFVEPTVFSDVKDEMTIAREEIFGPVISAMPFDEVDEVIRRANASSYGLGSGVWTQNMRNAHLVSRGLQAGSVWINCYQSMDPTVPFGGYKMSGYGRESGVEHMDEFLQTKAVWQSFN